MAVARRLQAADRTVVLVDESADVPDLPVVRADPTDIAALREAELNRDAVVVVATPSDSQNLLAAQLVRARFDVDRVVVLTNHPDRVEAFADVGHDSVCATELLADGLVDRL
jgi:trk system potassium uptake protein TrkA